MSNFKKAFVKIGSALSVILVCMALILIVLQKQTAAEQTAPEQTAAEQTTPEQTTPEQTEAEETGVEETGVVLANTTRPSALDQPPAFDKQNITVLNDDMPLPPPVRDLRFGAVQTYETPDVATAAGVGWTRVLLPWSELQRDGADHWDEGYFRDDVLNEELNANRQPVGLLIGTPAWASAAGGSRDVPEGLYLPYDHPNNHWGQFVKRIVQRYRGRIDYWILWNEPDIWNNDQGTQSWNGTLEDYVQLLKVGYLAAKSVNNNAVIGAAATTYWWDRAHQRELYLTRMLQAIQQDPEAAANNGFFDFVGLNLYYDPDQIYDIIRTYRQELNRNGFANKQVWLTETNAPPSNDPPVSAPFNMTLEQQSYFLIQTWAMSIASGANRIESYKMKDGQYGGAAVLPYGIQRKDGTLRPLFWSYRTVVTYLSDYQGAELTREGEIRRVTVSRGRRGTTTVVWNKSLQAQTVNVPATANSALLVDAFGALRLIQPQNGQYTLRLPARPGQGEQVGGRPFLIVEGAGAEMILDRPGPDDIPNIPPVDDPVISSLPATATNEQASEAQVLPS
ncbi:MAG: hypothetical protein ACPGWR_30045 [Ardenticatenaceae bacterium]